MNRALADYLSRRANRAFRGLVRYEGDELDVLYSRDDLEPGEMRQRAETIRRAVRPRRHFASLDELGKPRATVQMRDRAVILHFPVGGDDGYLVGLEPDVARDLSGFVDDCVRIIRKSEHAAERQ